VHIFDDNHIPTKSHWKNQINMKQRKSTQVADSGLRIQQKTPGTVVFSGKFPTSHCTRATPEPCYSCSIIFSDLNENIPIL
jgi:hypothetical protein